MQTDLELMTFDEAQQAVAANLKARRDELELSQQAVAERLGWKQEAYNVYEKGRRNPTLKTLVLLANALNTSHITLQTPGAYTIQPDPNLHVV